jgi:hypothetical protein
MLANRAGKKIRRQGWRAQPRNFRRKKRKTRRKTPRFRDGFVGLGEVDKLSINCLAAL